MDIREFFDRALSLLFPPRCVICQKLCAYDDALCGDCSYEFSGGEDEKVITSGALGTVTFIAYDSLISKAMVSYKKYGGKRATDFFCGGIMERISEKWGDIAFGAVIPVPMNKKRRRETGFNQAQLLAQELSRRLEAPMLANVLHRLDTGVPQHTLGRREREENAAKSFVYGDIAGIKDLNVLLVDDIITTGATARACARLLLKAGAASVCVAAVAND